MDMVLPCLFPRLPFEEKRLISTKFVTISIPIDSGPSM